MKEFDGYVVLIPGGCSGIGRETAKLFVQGGAEVIIAGRRKECAQQVMDESGVKVSWKKCDVTKSEELNELRQYVEEKYGKVDTLVNCAATIRWGNLEQLAEEDWHLVVDTMLTGPFLTLKHFIPLLKKSKNPSVVNISSLAAEQNWPGCAPYGAAKAAIDKFTRQVTRDLHWLRCNSIQPGIIDTPMYDLFLGPAEKAGLFQQYASLTPAGRVGKPADIANAILFLSSEKASFINGATLLIDGGFVQNWLPGW